MSQGILPQIGTTVTIGDTASTSQQIIAGGLDLLLVTNIGSSLAWFCYGEGTQEAVTSETEGVCVTPIPPGGSQIFLVNPAVTNAWSAICPSGESTTLNVMQGYSTATPSSAETPTIAETYGPRTFTINTFTAPPYSSTGGDLATNFGMSVAPGGSATVKGYWSKTAPTSEPTADGVNVIDVSTMSGAIGPEFVSGNLAGYVPSPAAGIWYLSFWIDNDGSNNGGFVMSEISFS